jgi:hypothetical protein
MQRSLWTLGDTPLTGPFGLAAFEDALWAVNSWEHARRIIHRSIWETQRALIGQQVTYVVEESIEVSRERRVFLSASVCRPLPLLASLCASLRHSLSWSCPTLFWFAVQKRTHSLFLASSGACSFALTPCAHTPRHSFLTVIVALWLSDVTLVHPAGRTRFTHPPTAGISRYSYWEASGYLCPKPVGQQDDQTAGHWDLGSHLFLCCSVRAAELLAIVINMARARGELFKIFATASPAFRFPPVPALCVCVCMCVYKRERERE